MALPNRGWRNCARGSTTPTSRGADRRPTAAPRTSVCRARRSSSSTPLRTPWITFTRFIVIPPTTTEPSLRAGRTAALALALTTAIALGSRASAHRRDEYLQAARIAVEPGRVDLELDLTPGITVADTMIGDIDRDR